MGLMGFSLGAIAAWTTGAKRVFMHTLAVPIAIVISRVAFPLKESHWYVAYVVADFAIVYLAAFIGDYLMGLRLGRNDRGGYRNDSVGH